MSILSTPDLQGWYNDSWSERESDTMVFWQTVFSEHFPTPRYILALGAPPDASLRRADAALYRRADGGRRKVVLLWLEAKHAYEVARVVEQQVLDAASLFLKSEEGQGNDDVFAMSVIGPTFRVWRVRANTTHLEPFHGDALRNDKSQYLDAKTEAAGVVFFRMVNEIMAKDQ